MMALKPRTICNDGASLSIQASRTHYCTPRKDEGPHSAMEVGCILDADGNRLAPPETWKDYTDGPTFPNDIYGYVPIELIDAFIAEHGGRQERIMDPIYLLAICRKTRDKTSKLTRIAKCSHANDSFGEDGHKIGEWWAIKVIDNPLPAMLGLVFVGSEVDPGVRAAEALAERLSSGLSIASGQKWEIEACGPIDSEDAALVRIEMEVLTSEGE